MNQNQNWSLHMNDFHRRYNLPTDRLISFFTCTLVSTTPSFHRAPEKRKDDDMGYSDIDVLSRRNAKMQENDGKVRQGILSLPAPFHSYTCPLSLAQRVLVMF
jgi:hypothetical protein